MYKTKVPENQFESFQGPILRAEAEKGRQPADKLKGF
jgi:hypothetical protein